jgi:serine/threonine protein phosphatase 1
MIKRYELNQAGRDFVVGDIHGAFDKLSEKLEAIGFNELKDRLFSCGDLVDRNPGSVDALGWLAKPWFHPVRGNHDDYVCRYLTCDHENWIYNGGAWFFGLSSAEQREFFVQFNELPLVIDVETSSGLVGIVHADPIVSDWGDLSAFMSNRNRQRLMWSRERFESENTSTVTGIARVYCGHTPVHEPVTLGNVHHIDTAGWHSSGYFTVIQL